VQKKAYEPLELSLCGRLALTNSQIPTHLLAHSSSPPSKKGVVEKTGRTRMKNLKGWNKDG